MIALCRPALIITSLVCGPLLQIPSALAQNPAQVVASPVGALAWIEPKSRIITIGSPSIVEGARVGELLVKEGDAAQKGQILGTFSTYAKNKSSLDVAKAQVTLAETTLARVKAGNVDSDILSQRENIRSLIAQEEAGIKEFSRIEKLYNDKLVTKSNYDSVMARRDSLSAQRKAAEATLKSLSVVRPDDIAIAKNQLEIARSELAVAQANVELAQIRAPIDGTILTIYARDSESVGDAGVMDIANLDTMDAVAEIDENDILKIVKGQKSEISVTGLNKIFSGTVRDIGGQIKKNAILDSSSTQMLDTRIVEVRIELDKTDNDILRRLVNRKARARIFP